MKRIPGPDGGWDYASFDPSRHRVYLSHQTSVIALDAVTGVANFAFAKGEGLHAIVPVPGTDVIVTTDRGDETARVLSARDGRLLASIPVANDADGAGYDPKSGLVVVISGDSGILTLIDPRAMKAVGRIDVGDHMEFGAADGTGRFFVNLSEKNQVAVVDLAGRKVTARYDLPGCKGPTGLAYVSGDRVISDCANGAVDILKAGDGEVLARFTGGRFPDSVLYDSRRQLAFAPSAIAGTMSVIALSGPANNTIVDTVPTQVGARTGAVDPASGRIFLPTATYAAPTAPGKRPAPVPGTFVILVVGR
jgi:DNA-binding beta-propeller fold protein YncE